MKTAKSKVIVTLSLIAVVLITAAAVYLANSCFIGGVPYWKHSSKLSLNGKSATTEQLLQFDKLKSLDLGQTILSPKELETLQKELPNCDISWKLRLCGLELSSKDTVVKLGEAKALKVEDIIENLPYLPALELIEPQGKLADEDILKLLRASTGVQVTAEELRLLSADGIKPLIPHALRALKRLI
ncbi:MAG: hypothetical protein LBS74_06790 [Oscillospiraceae bacterium]|jgi:hypothetical protein|nr:hypothetical protein [Oscillospiraceae bacterium]